MMASSFSAWLTLVCSSCKFSLSFSSSSSWTYDGSPMAAGGGTLGERKRALVLSVQLCGGRLKPLG